MKYYLKIKNTVIVEAPKTMVKEDYTIYGYNKLNNEDMLIQDGYTAFDKPAYFYKIENGEIVEKEEKEELIVDQTIFTKLEIRRACRALNLENKLDTLINSDDKYKADWQDAQLINLNDDMFVLAVQTNVFTNELIQSIKDYLR